MAKYELTIKNNETGMVDKLEGEGLILIMNEDNDRQLVQAMDATANMYVAALIEDKNWQIARELAAMYEKDKRKAERRAKIKGFFGFGGDGD